MDFRQKKKIDCSPLRRGVYEDRLRRCALGEKTTSGEEIYGNIYPNRRM
jgi:hypothetical protein